MNGDSVLDLFQGVSVSRPPEQVVMQIRRLIAKGLLKPGDMLPPERSLSEKLGISRGHVREGIKTLELYGIVKCIQGRGTEVTDLGMQTMGGVISNLLNITTDDMLALMDTRILLESHAARLAAGKSDADDKAAMQAIVGEMHDVIGIGDTEKWLETDLRLHMLIARASHNPVLMELVKFLTPNIVGHYRKFFRGRISMSVELHEEIVDNIVKGRAAKSGKLMHNHLVAARKVFADLFPEPGRSKGRRKKRVAEKSRKIKEIIT